MIGIDLVIRQCTGLAQDDLLRWIENDWVRPQGRAGAWRFHAADVARTRLILELRDDLDVNEAALPIVLHLLDQLYDLRRRIAAG